MTITRFDRPLRLMLPLVLIVTLSAVRAAAQVRDDAGFFSPAVVEKANAQIKEMRQQYGKDLLIETIPSVSDDLKDQLAAQGKERFFSSYAAQRAKAAGIDGIYVLITKDPSYLKVAVGNETARKAFTTANRDELASSMLSAFKQKQYDQGLEKAVDFVRRTLSANSAAAGAAQRSSAAPTAGTTAYPSRPSQPARQGPSLLFWLIIGVVAFLAIRFIMRLVNRGNRGGFNQQQQYPPQEGTGPYGAQPPFGGGYGYGGGGGFGRGILGGLLGGLAGGWMMDQYRNRNDTAYGAGGATPPPLPPTDPNAGGGVFGDANDTSFSTNEGGAFDDSSGADFGAGGDVGVGDFGGGGDSGGGGDF
jgi:uncharacterized membrane protein YgcG